MNGPYILPIDRFRVNSKAGGPRGYLTCGGFTIMSVFVVLIVFADVDDRQLPQRSHVHGFVEQSLTQRAVAEKTDCDLIAAAHPDRQRRAGSDPCAAADD